MPGCRVFWLVACLVVCQRMAVIAVMNEEDEMTTEDMKYKQAMAYLKRCNYLPDENMGDPVDDFVTALKNFQQVANIPDTGKLDENTLEMMKNMQCSGPEAIVPMKRKRRAAGDICTNPRFDAVVNMGGRVYGFIGEYYVTLAGSNPGYVRRVRDRWPELSTPIDAAVYRKRFVDTSLWSTLPTDPAHTLFFKGDKVWRYEGNSLKYGYPKSISTLFYGLPSDIDSAFEFTTGVLLKQTLLYFTKGTKYYRYTRGPHRRIDRSYPMTFSVYWCNMPSTVDAAFSLNRKAIFFKGSQFYVYGSSKPGPFAIGKWLGC